MSVEKKISLWNEVQEYSRKLDSACVEVQGCFDPEREVQLVKIQQMVHNFRQVLAVLHLMRNESELLAALIGHDFLNQVSGLHLRLDQLTKQPTQERLNRACRRIWVIRQIIESLVFWIDHQRVKLTEVLLDEYVFKIANHMQDNFPQVHFSGRCETEHIPVLMYQPIVTNFIINSIVNAIKHGEAKQIEFVAFQKSDKAHMDILDNGKGIKVPYESIMSGLGLLMIDRRLAVMDALLEVEGHGGIDGGALFRVIFPLTPDSVKEKVVDLPDPPEGLGKGC